MNLKDAGIYDLKNIFKGEATRAHTLSQGGIINGTSRLINIPAYQRPYRWTANNIIRLFQDYHDNNDEYFLGCVVIVEKRKANNEIEFDVIDGQQRITTLYLLNYIRYLLKREYTLEKLSKPNQLKASEYCKKLKDCYVNLIGKNENPFNCIMEKIEELARIDNLNPNAVIEHLTSYYKEQLCVAETKSSVEETNEEKLRKAHEFFNQEQLCLKYSRSRYDKVLKEALCRVNLKNVQDTTDYELDVVNEDDCTDVFLKNYLEALKIIFNQIWQYVKKDNSSKNISRIEKCGRAIELADEIVKNVSFCVVLTAKESDANKLFEVLNDRALKVDDLELIKNHFYKEYCTKSSDKDEEKDFRISQLDELWTDKIFNGNANFKDRFISYLAAVYLTCSSELVYRDDIKCKDEIEKSYSSKRYSINEYAFNNILSDFNVYYAVKIILELFDIKAKGLNGISLEAEQDSKSITYKTLHLLNALKYHSVIAALTNVIISVYVQQHSLASDNFEKDFEKFIKGLIEDENHSEKEYQKIHQCAYMLWIAAIKGKNHNIPRKIAKRIIEKNGYVGFCEAEMDFQGNEIRELDKEFDEWLNSWNFDNNKTFIIKLLLLNLLLCQRLEGTKAYKADTVTIKVSALTYRLDVSKLQLDHLEAKIINPVSPKSYYLYDDPEEREKHVNGYIGNFMILDAADNNQKNNLPLKEAIKYYETLKPSWLVEDIEGMINDKTFFDLQKGVPKKEFFSERSRRLKKYFKTLLNRNLYEKEIRVQF